MKFFREYFREDSREDILAMWGTWLSPNSLNPVPLSQFSWLTNPYTRSFFCSLLILWAVPSRNIARKAGAGSISQSRCCNNEERHAVTFDDRKGAGVVFMTFHTLPAAWSQQLEARTFRNNRARDEPTFMREIPRLMTKPHLLSSFEYSVAFDDTVALTSLYLLHCISDIMTTSGQGQNIVIRQYFA